MRVEDLQAELRPRTPWEAADLGLEMLRRWGRDVGLAWVIVFLPLWGLVWGSLWAHPGWAVLLCWWLEPWGDKLVLHILSRALFGERQGLRAALRAVPGLVLQRGLATLTIYRLSPLGTLYMPVLQLEDLPRRQLKRRIRHLFASQQGVALLVTTTNLLLRWSLVLGAFGLLYLFTRHPATGHVLWWDALWEGHTPWWFWYAFPGALFLATGLTQSLNMASAFGIYLNRRVWLEGWDVEIRFRQMAGRLETGSAGAGAVRSLHRGVGA